MIRLSDLQWERIRHHFPEENIADGRPGRRPVSTRQVLEGTLWILNTGAQWHMLPQCYPNYKTVHRRFQTWCRSEVLRGILMDIANELRERGVLDEEECFIDVNFRDGEGRRRRGRTDQAWKRHENHGDRGSPRLAALGQHPRRASILLTLGPIGEEQRRSETELWREFELARPAILGAVLDAAAHGLRAVDSVHLGRLPRMADFALWATACETGLWPAGTFTCAYAANRKAAIESIIDADPIAACVREFMSERPSWTGSAADLLRVSAECSSDRIPRAGTGWPKNPRALAGHLRRAQTFLRALGIEIAFSREGRIGSKVIRMRSFPENTVSTVSDSGSGADPEQQP